MKVLFIAINSIHEHEDSEFLGYEILISCLKKHHVDADIVQIEYKTEQENIIEHMNKIDLNKVVMVGINCMFPTFHFAKKICEYIKKINSKIHITIGGALPSVAAEDVLRMLAEADSVIIGEGENTICELYDVLVNGKELSKCDGIAYRNNENVCITPTRELIKDLDSIPFANRVMLERNKYQFARIQSSRGCEGNCAFCSESRFMKDTTNIHWRGRSPKNIIDEIEDINKIYKVDTFIFCDSSFEDPISYGQQRMLEICKEIKQRNLEIHFRVLFRAESVARMDNKILGELKSTGLFHVFLGVESGYEPALKVFHKRASVIDNARAITKIRENGLNLTTGFIMFHPYTSLIEIEENLKFIEENNLEFSTYSFISKMAIHKGSSIYYKAKADGLLMKDYSICNPYGYGFVHNEISELYRVLRNCFSILNRNSSKELVNLLTYLEDDFRKNEKNERFNDYCIFYFPFLEGIRKDVGKRQLELFKYVLYSRNYKGVLIDSKIEDLCNAIERNIRSLNQIHKEWIKIKIRNRVMRDA